MQGAADGIALCLKTVIPSMFPLIFLVNTFLSMEKSENNLLVKMPAAFLGLPDNCSDLVIPILLGGYPLGAIAVNQAFKAGKISSGACCRLLLFCNNPGPAFIFGIMPAVFENKIYPLLLWMIQLSAVVIIASVKPVEKKAEANKISFRGSEQVMLGSLKSMGIICGWIVLFRILINLLLTISIFKTYPVLKIATIGCIELSNGCIALNSISDLSTRFILASVMMAFGGLCVTMQTLSVLKGIPTRNYFIGKILNSVISLVLSVSFIHLKIYTLPILIVVFAICKLNRKINSRFSSPVRV